jgi:hypothetical protein
MRAGPRQCVRGLVNRRPRALAAPRSCCIAPSRCAARHPSCKKRAPARPGHNDSSGQDLNTSRRGRARPCPASGEATGQDVRIATSLAGERRNTNPVRPGLECRPRVPWTHETARPRAAACVEMSFFSQSCPDPRAADGVARRDAPSSWRPVDRRDRGNGHRLPCAGRASLLGTPCNRAASRGQAPAASTRDNPVACGHGLRGVDCGAWIAGHGLRGMDCRHGVGHAHRRAMRTTVAPPEIAARRHLHTPAARDARRDALNSYTPDTDAERRRLSATRSPASPPDRTGGHRHRPCRCSGSRRNVAPVLARAILSGMPPSGMPPPGTSQS